MDENYSAHFKNGNEELANINIKMSRLEKINETISKMDDEYSVEIKNMDDTITRLSADATEIKTSFNDLKDNSAKKSDYLRIQSDLTTIERSLKSKTTEVSNINHNINVINGYIKKFVTYEPQYVLGQLMPG